MAAERDKNLDPQRVQYLSLVVLFEHEADANELLSRLESLSVNTSEAAIVRVDNSVPAYSRNNEAARKGLSPEIRNALTGAIIGSAISLMIGFVLYEAGIFRLPFGDGLSPHALVSALAGAIAGGVIGALFKPLLKNNSRPATDAPINPAAELAASHLSRDGFLVVVKVPPHLGEQAETIARRLGAKEIIL
jgi:hypothetical protein